MTPYQIRKLKERIKDLEQLCDMAGVPYLLVAFPRLALKKYKASKKEIKWAMEKIKEYKEKFNPAIDSKKQK